MTDVDLNALMSAAGDSSGAGSATASAVAPAPASTADTQAATAVAAPAQTASMAAAQIAPAPAATAAAAGGVTLADLMGANADSAAPASQDTEMKQVAADVEKASQLTPAEQEKAAQIASTINFMASDVDSTYAADAQKAMTNFSDSVLSKTSNKDAGEAGEYLADLLGTINKSKLDDVPIIGTVSMKLKAMQRKYQKVDAQMDEIVAKLEKSKAQMVKDIAMYDRMYAENLVQYKQLKIYVAAGKKALKDFYANQMPALEQQVQASNDPMAAQTLKDFKDKLERFAKRLDDLDRVSVICLQTAPQIKILQNADKTIQDKINTTITTTIPVWKSQMVLAVGLANQQKAIELQNAADDLTNKLIGEMAGKVHQGAVNAAKAGQRSVIDIETIQKVNNELISTLQETVQIQKEGRAAREQAEGQMRKMEADLKNALINQANKM